VKEIQKVGSVCGPVPVILGPLIVSTFAFVVFLSIRLDRTFAECSTMLGHWIIRLLWCSFHSWSLYLLVGVFN
jgi:hypothetical protein